MGNHLIDCVYGLIFSAFFINNTKLFDKAAKILFSELNEQILDDGFHFELSTMYHKIILYRLLDAINLLQNNHRFEKQAALLAFMYTKAAAMLGAINAVTFSDGFAPHLNDSAPGIAPETGELNQYAALLGVTANRIPAQLNDSGYRVFKNNLYECVIDIGQIGASYQPGHAHADTFNFVLNVHGKPLIVDTGISTYNAGETRQRERGTAAHNTVTVLDKDSSEVWPSFRVGRRANVEIIEDSERHVEAEHDGYCFLGTKHCRKWSFGENEITISDRLAGRVTQGKAYLLSK